MSGAQVWGDTAGAQPGRSALLALSAFVPALSAGAVPRLAANARDRAPSPTQREQHAQDERQGAARPPWQRACAGTRLPNAMTVGLVPRSAAVHALLSHARGAVSKPVWTLNALFVCIERLAECV